MLSWHKKTSDSKRLSFLILGPGISIDGIRPASSKQKREGIAFFLIHFEALLLTDVVDCLIFPQPSRVRYSSNVAQVVGSAHDFDQHKIGTRKYHHPNRSRLVIPISAWCYFAALYPSYWYWCIMYLATTGVWSPSHILTKDDMLLAVLHLGSASLSTVCGMHGSAKGSVVILTLKRKELWILAYDWSRKAPKWHSIQEKL